MYTQCPFCQTVFGVADEHLAAAAGQVRCGYCKQLFNAEENLLIGLPEQDNETDIDETGQARDASSAEAIGEEGMLEEEEGAAPQQPSIYQQTALSPPNNDDQAALNAIFADLDTRLVRMSEQTSDTQDEEGKEEELPERIAPTIDLSLDDIESSGYYPTPSREERGPQQPYIDPDDLETLDKLGFDEIEEAEADIAEFSENEAPSGNWDEVDTDTTIEFIHDTAAKQESRKKPAHGFLSEEDEPGDDETPSARAEEREEEPLIGVEPPMDFEQEELPYHLRDSFATQEAVPRSRWRLLFVTLLFFLALTGIIFQLALFRNVELANKLPQLKPYLSQFCRYFPCTFSGPKEVKRIHITDREVRAHPKMKNALLVSAIFVNRAEISQPYPDIVLTLSDLTNTVLAQRRFSPADYLSKTKDRFQLMNPGVPLHIQLEVLDPGNDAVNFEFTFK